jgi:hypothetical protein
MARDPSVRARVVAVRARRRAARRRAARTPPFESAHGAHQHASMRSIDSLHAHPCGVPHVLESANCAGWMRRSVRKPRAHRRTPPIATEGHESRVPRAVFVCQWRLPAVLASMNECRRWWLGVAQWSRHCADRPRAESTRVNRESLVSTHSTKYRRAHSLVRPIDARALHTRVDARHSHTRTLVTRPRRDERRTTDDVWCTTRLSSDIRRY